MTTVFRTPPEEPITFAHIHDWALFALFKGSVLITAQIGGCTFLIILVSPLIFDEMTVRETIAAALSAYAVSSAFVWGRYWHFRGRIERDLFGSTEWESKFLSSVIARHQKKANIPGPSSREARLLRLEKIRKALENKQAGTER